MFNSVEVDVENRWIDKFILSGWGHAAVKDTLVNWMYVDIFDIAN